MTTTQRGSIVISHFTSEKTELEIQKTYPKDSQFWLSPVTCYSLEQNMSPATTTKGLCAEGLVPMQVLLRDCRAVVLGLPNAATL